MVSTPFIVAITVALTSTVSSVDATNQTASTDFEREEAPYFGTGRQRCYFLKDADRVGFDLVNKPGKSYYDCANLCYTEKHCVTWSWSNLHGGTCWLKSAEGRVVKNPGAVSMSCKLKWEEDNYICRVFQDIDFVGNDIGSQPSALYENCCGICEATPGCSAYAWNKDNGGVVSSTTKQLNGPVCPFQYDTDFEGNDIGNKPAKDAGVCCSQCKENAVCKAYTWSNYQGGTCWMKSGAGKTTKASGVISAWLAPYRY